MPERSGEGGLDARAERRRRAREEALEVTPRSDRAYPSYEVRNPIRGTRHRVLAPEGPDGPILLCLCPDFGRRDVGTCKHVEAVRAGLGTLPPAGRTPVAGTGEAWARIDRALAAEPPRPWTDLRPRERSGRELLRPLT